jgi:toxin ParE1/3/4
VIRWAPAAIRQLREIHAYIAEQDPSTAAVVLGRIRDAAQTIDQFPLVGRLGWTQGTREIVVPRTPYILIYRYTSDVVVIARIRHGAQRWPLTP